MQRSNIKTLTGRVHNLFRQQSTLENHEIHKLYHERGILTGYRLPGQSVFRYALSAFQMNNETVNIWTHAIGFIVILFRINHLVKEFGADDIRISPLLGFGACCLLNTGLSVIAHTFHSASPTIHYTCFQADYAGIGLFCFGGALPVFYLSADKQTRTSFKSWFLPINVILSWFCFLCLCVAKLRYHCPYSQQRKLLQILPVSLHLTMSMAPLCRRICMCYSDESCEDPVLFAYGKVIAIAILCALSFSSHFPEKLWPGYFDFIGQGHHLFHIFTIYLSLSHFDAATEDILHFQQDNLHDSNDIPTAHCLLYVIFGLTIFSAITILALRPIVLQRIQDDKKV